MTRFDRCGQLNCLLRDLFCQHLTSSQNFLIKLTVFILLFGQIVYCLLNSYFYLPT